MSERYFIIKNDVTDKYKILESDTPEQQLEKRRAHMAEFAVFDPDTNTWTMQLPQWFAESEFEDKALIMEMFTYYKPDGTMDLGTSFHSPTLSDGEFHQFDNMICMANDQVERIFYIDSRTREIEFWFRDYMSEENLSDHEFFDDYKYNEEGKQLYYERVPTITKVTEPPGKTIIENEYPVVIHLTDDDTDGERWFIQYLDPEKYDGLAMTLRSEADLEEDDEAWKYPCLLQHQQSWYDVPSSSEVYQTTKKTKFPVVVRVRDHDGDLVYLTNNYTFTNEAGHENEDGTETPYIQVYTYAYDGEGNQLFWQVFDTQEEDNGIPVLHHIVNKNNKPVYLEPTLDGWEYTLKETEFPLYVPKYDWENSVSSYQTRYYKFREGVTHRKTTEVTDLPCYILATNSEGLHYKVDSHDGKTFGSMKLENTEEVEEDFALPVYVQETTTSGQLVYWETLAETTVPNDDPVIENTNHKAAFVIVCRLRC